MFLFPSYIILEGLKRVKNRSSSRSSDVKNGAVKKYFVPAENVAKIRLLFALVCEFSFLEFLRPFFRPSFFQILFFSLKEFQRELKKRGNFSSSFFFFSWKISPSTPWQSEKTYEAFDILSRDRHRLSHLKLPTPVGTHCIWVFSGWSEGICKLFELRTGTYIVQ